MRVRLGVNIDHVATVRNARGGDNPDPVRAALTGLNSGTFPRRFRASSQPRGANIGQMD